MLTLATPPRGGVAARSIAGGRVHGRAVQGQPRRGVPPGGGGGGGGCGGRAVDAVRRRRVQSLPDRVPRPRLLLRHRRRRRPSVPPPLVDLCGHATLASAHFLFTTVLGKQYGTIEFVTKSGILTATKVPAPESTGVSGEKRFIELDFPMADFVGCNSAEMPSIPETLNGAHVVSVWKTSTAGDLIVELSSGKEVADIVPNIAEIKKCAGRGVLVTGPAPPESAYDFYSRFFCPKCGVDEDPVCGSAHCVLAPYWGGKLGKQKLTAFQASTRSGTLYLELDSENRRVRIKGEAVTVMVGTLMA